jgi:hypothetical protein
VNGKMEKMRKGREVITVRKEERGRGRGGFLFS